jgi:cytochrome c6
LLSSCGNDAPKTPETAGSSERQYGSDVFRNNCVSCHGATGDMGINGAFDLTKSKLSLAEKIAVITNGRKVMTPFKQLLTADEIKSVAEYTETLKK